MAKEAGVRFGPFGLVVGVSGLFALLAIFLPRSGGFNGAHLADVSGWSSGFGLAGAVLLLGAAGLFVMAALPSAPRLGSAASTGALMLSALAAAIVTIRIVSIPRGADAVSGTVVHYGPQIGIWVALVACAAQLVCLAVFVTLRRRNAHRLYGELQLSLAVMFQATSELDRALSTGASQSRPTLGDSASGLLVACSDVMSCVRQQRPRRESERGWAELGAAAGALRNAAVLFRSLGRATGDQYAARADACRTMLAQGQDHLHRYGGRRGSGAMGRR